ncbi:MAG TPA: CocE/NonD family hydrolase [Anaerolineales bacterium]|nr:CocE/NonD family hydrolase [Anaerolineales bacterium]
MSRRELWIDFDVRVPMRDGVELSANIFRPQSARAGERFPAILIRTPYDKHDSRNLEQARAFTPFDYVVVVMDVRGRGDSDGEFVPYRNEGRDGYDSIEWCAAQPWCSGAVGTLGGSYLGRIQWFAALEQPPHLKTMIVLVPPSDPFVESPTGVTDPMSICWHHIVSGRTTKDVDFIDWMPIYEHLPLLTMDERSGRAVPHWRANLAHTQLDEYWRALCYQDKFDQIDLPVMHISGWYDDEEIGTPLNFAGMTRQAPTEFARRNQKLIMGPGGHRVNQHTRLGEVDFGPQALIDLQRAQRRWFDRWLKDEPNGIEDEPPVEIFVMGTNAWRAEQEWPLARAKQTNWYLHSQGRANSRFGDGRLALVAPQDEPADIYCYNPARPTPFITEPTSAQIGGPDDYAAVWRRDDILVYLSEPLEQDLEVTGPVRLELYAASSALDTDFMALLVDVHPNGFMQRLCDGMVRARFRRGMDQPELLTPGQIERFEIALWDTSQVFMRGHRLGLGISSSAFPKYARNLNTGGDLATETEMIVAEQRVYHAAAYPSRLILPVIPPRGRKP